MSNHVILGMLSKPVLFERPPGVQGVAGDKMAGQGAGQQGKQPNQQQLQCRWQRLGLQSQTQADQTQSQIVSLGQGVQPGEYVGKAQQTDGTGDEKARPQGQQNRAEHVNGRRH